MRVRDVGVIGPAAVPARRRMTLSARYGHLWFVLPGLLIFGLFKVYPTVVAFQLSLYSYSGLGNDKRFIGLANFTEALTSPAFYNAVAHNLAFFLVLLVVQNTVGLFLAVQLNAKPRFMEVYRTILFLPVILSLVATGFIWTLILSPNIGILNPFLQEVGLGFLAQDWLTDTRLALPSVIMVQAWNHLGWAIVIYLSGLQSVPRELGEAATIDGANAWQKFWRVTFPMLAPAFGSLTVLTFIQNIRVFDVVYVIAGPIGSPAGRTDVLGTLVYRTAFGASAQTSADIRLGYALAIAILMFIMMLITCALLIHFLRRREVSE